MYVITAEPRYKEHVGTVEIGAASRVLIQGVIYIEIYIEVLL